MNKEEINEQTKKRRRNIERNKINSEITRKRRENIRRKSEEEEKEKQ